MKSHELPLVELVHESVGSKLGRAFCFDETVPIDHSDIPNEVSEALFGMPTRQLGELSMSIVEVGRFYEKIDAQHARPLFDDVPFRASVAIGSRELVDDNEGEIRVVQLGMVHPEMYSRWLQAIRLSDFYDPISSTASIDANRTGAQVAGAIYMQRCLDDYGCHNGAVGYIEVDTVQANGIYLGPLDRDEHVLAPYVRDRLTHEGELTLGDGDVFDMQRLWSAVFDCLVEYDSCVMDELLPSYITNTNELSRELEFIDTLDDEVRIAVQDVVDACTSELEEDIKDRLQTRTEEFIVGDCVVTDWLRGIVPNYRESRRSSSPIERSA